MDHDDPEAPPALGRQLALLAVVFVAAFVLLLGGAALVRQLGTAGSATASPSSSPGPDAAASPGSSGGGSSAPSSGGGSSAPSSGGGSSAPSSEPSNAPSVAPGPTALVDDAGNPILIGAGDIADCESDGDEATAALLDGLPGTIFTAGDNVYDSATPETFRDCYEPTWGRHLARTRPAAGNHDWQDGGIEAYRAYFGPAAGGPDTTWYAYDLGTWRIIVLDSNCNSVDGCDADSEQGRWLADELAANPARCTLAIWHHPRWSSGDEHGNSERVAPFWEALYPAGVDVIVNGHDHDYERFAPQDPDGNEDRVAGMREFVVGTGGTELRGFDDPEPNSELRASVSHGLLEFTLRDGGYDWRFIPTQGDFSDRGSASCH